LDEAKKLSADLRNMMTKMKELEKQDKGFEENIDGEQ